MLFFEFSIVSIKNSSPSSIVLVSTKALSRVLKTLYILFLSSLYASMAMLSALSFWTSKSRFFLKYSSSSAFGICASRNSCSPLKPQFLICSQRRMNCLMKEQGKCCLLTKLKTNHFWEDYSTLSTKICRSRKRENERSYYPKD